MSYHLVVMKSTLLYCISCVSKMILYHYLLYIIEALYKSSQLKLTMILSHLFPLGEN